MAATVTLLLTPKKGETMATFTVRITEEEGQPVAWIDRDGLICIKQPHAPGLEGTPWSSADEAQAWADAHAAELEAYEAQVQEAQAQAIAREEALIAQAQMDSAKLEEIHAMLTQLLTK